MARYEFGECFDTIISTVINITAASELVSLGKESSEARTSLLMRELSEAKDLLLSDLRDFSKRCGYFLYDRPYIPRIEASIERLREWEKCDEEWKNIEDVGKWNCFDSILEDVGQTIFSIIEDVKEVADKRLQTG